jgi:hypothetical protein
MTNEAQNHHHHLRDGDSRERLEFPVTNRAQADEIVREIFPERNVNPERLNGDYRCGPGSFRIRSRHRAHRKHQPHRQL